MDDAGPAKSSSDSTKTTVAVLVAMVVVLMVAGIGIATVRDANETIRRATATTTSTALAAGATATTGTTAPASDLSPEQTRVVEETKAQVAAIRGLEWKSSVPVRLLSREALARRVKALNAKEFADNRDELAVEESVLKLLQLIPRDADYAKVIDQIVSGGALGFYDPEVKALYVGGSPSGPLDAATRSVLAHELTHALTDQHFDFGTRVRALDDADRTEEAAAFSAVAEGDAELVRTLWEDRHLTDRERAQAAAAGSADGGAYDKAPRFLLESLFFPYEDGFSFVRSRHRAGGFAEVDNAYRQPPTSTEHILHPDTYPGQTWTAPALPDLALATGCGGVDKGTLGEFDMAQVLVEEISRGDARAAAAGWNGDAYAVVRCGTALGLADRWQTDSPGDANRLADALLRWARGWSGSTRSPDADGRFSGPSGAGRVIRSAGRVELVLADDVATADRLARALAAG